MWGGEFPSSGVVGGSVVLSSVCFEVFDGPFYSFLDFLCFFFDCLSVLGRSSVVLFPALLVVSSFGVAVVVSLSFRAFLGPLPFSAAVSILSMNGSCVGGGSFCVTMSSRSCDDSGSV